MIRYNCRVSWLVSVVCNLITGLHSLLVFLEHTMYDYAVCSKLWKSLWAYTSFKLDCCPPFASRKLLKQ